MAGAEVTKFKMCNREALFFFLGFQESLRHLCSEQLVGLRLTAFLRSGETDDVWEFHHGNL